MLLGGGPACTFACCLSPPAHEPTGGCLFRSPWGPDTRPLQGRPEGLCAGAHEGAEDPPFCLSETRGSFPRCAPLLALPASPGQAESRRGDLGISLALQMLLHQLEEMGH